MLPSFIQKCCKEKPTQSFLLFSKWNINFTWCLNMIDGCLNANFNNFWVFHKYYWRLVVIFTNYDVKIACLSYIILTVCHKFWKYEYHKYLQNNPSYSTHHIVILLSWNEYFFSFLLFISFSPVLVSNSMTSICYHG